MCYNYNVNKKKLPLNQNYQPAKQPAKKTRKSIPILEAAPAKPTKSAKATKSAKPATPAKSTKSTKSTKSAKAAVLTKPAKLEAESVKSTVKPSGPKTNPAGSKARPAGFEAELSAPTASEAIPETDHVKPSRFSFSLKLLARIFAIISSLLLLALFINIYRLGLLPLKYLALVFAAVAVPSAIILLLAYLGKKQPARKIISLILSIPLSIAAVFGFLKINDTADFFSSFGAAEATNTYNVLVAKDSLLDESSDLHGQRIHVYRDLSIDSSLVSEAVSGSLGAEAVFSDDLLALINSATSDSDYVIALDSGAYDSLLEENASYGQGLKIIRTFAITTESVAAPEIDITQKPFTIYASGIDTRTGTLPPRSLSDVNIVITINPLEHKILLVSIPRDYYVHLAGTPAGALRDKLTHAGTLGGIQLSKATVEELLDINIDYYARVNFNFVENLVDAIGGINIYSDVDYAFTANGTNCTFRPGNNYVYGACALAFARERKSYSSGDRHRGENQEQVISRVIEKLTSSTTLLSNYSDILASLRGTFETSFDMDDMSKFIRAQLEDMKGWAIVSQNLDGTTGLAPTYSYPSQDLSVMFPDQATVEAAHAAILTALGIEPESESESEPSE